METFGNLVLTSAILCAVNLLWYTVASDMGWPLVKSSAFVGFFLLVLTIFSGAIWLILHIWGA